MAKPKGPEKASIDTPDKNPDAPLYKVVDSVKAAKDQEYDPGERDRAVDRSGVGCGGGGGRVSGARDSAGRHRHILLLFDTQPARGRRPSPRGRGLHKAGQRRARYPGSPAAKHPSEYRGDAEQSAHLAGSGGLLHARR